MEEHQKELSKILGIQMGISRNGPASWPEIYAEIGKLQERADKQPEIRYFPSVDPMPLSSQPNVHYHHGQPCYNNPCVWSGTN